MDYKIVVTWSDGTTQEHGCATHTDVENMMVQIFRVSLASRFKMTNLSIINNAI